MEPLKYRYNEAYIAALTEALRKAHPPFPGEKFSALVFDETWDALELKERMAHISICLREVLPENFRDALAVLTEAAPAFGGFEGMFFPDFVARYGTHDWEASLPALAQLTRFSSSEFAIRPFIAADPDRVMRLMAQWAEDDNHHLRRLASEGCRPRLPWAMALPAFKKDPSPILPILKRLRDDDEEYVRRSVANNLNDISKDHPELILSLTEDWLGESPTRDRLLKHACRTLLKAGNPKAMDLFGFGLPQGVTVTGLTVSRPTLAIGEAQSFHFEVHTPHTRNLRLEYAIVYTKANHKSSRKVFKISEKEYPAGTASITRKQAFKDLSTRKHYPGTHGLEVLINGHVLAQTSFVLSS